MPAPVVQVDHDTLTEVARLLDRGAAGVRQATQRIHRQVEALRDGGWLGLGATAFYREMDEDVFPALGRLEHALTQAAQGTRRVDRIFLDAEEEAGRALAPNGAGSGPSVTPSGTGDAIDVSSLTAGRIRDAATALAKSAEAVDSNTARQLAAGNVKAYYMEDLKQPADIEDKLKKYKMDSAVYTIYLHPETGAELIVQKNAIGFANGTAIVGQRSLSQARWQSLLVHETNHILNPTDLTNTLNRFKSEFRAYSVAEFRGIADADKRAAAVKAHILKDYPIIKNVYDSDPDVKKAIDAHTRPDGDVTNKGTLK